MNNQSSPTFWYIASFVWTLFMGVTVVAIGLGAAYPPLNLVAKPFVCPNGDMTYTEDTSNPLPGTTYTIIGWSCVEKGDATEIPLFPMTIYSGLIYGLILYALGLAVFLFARRRQAAAPATFQSRPRQPATNSGQFNPNPRPNHPGHSAPTPASTDAMARMERLKELREANMITESEFQEKRADILKDL